MVLALETESVRNGATMARSLVNSVLEELYE